MKNNRQKIKVEPGYISLQEASKISPYSQEYLSLLARKRKLKCKKFGRTWYTTPENLQEYIKSQGIPVILPKAFYIPSYKGKITKPFFATFEEPLKKVEKIEEEVKIPAKIELPKLEFIKKIPFLNVLKISIAVLIVVSIFYYGWQTESYLVFKEYGKWVLESSKEFSVRTYKNLKKFFVEIPFKKKEVVKIPPEEIFLFERDFSGLEENIVGDVKERFGEFRKEYGLSKPEVEEGVVIVPRGLKDSEKFKKELETAFADKVEIEPDETGKAGIIKPVFAAPPLEEQEYLYMMVPVKEY
jgi:hypothetical protein